MSKLIPHLRVEYWIYCPGSLIWVHDYHLLLLVPKLLRLLVPDIYVGLFVHMAEQRSLPLPSSYVYKRFVTNVSRLVRISATLRHPAYEYVDMKLLRVVSTYKATSRLSCTHPSQSMRIVSRVNCELSPICFRFIMNTQVTSSSQHSPTYSAKVAGPPQALRREKDHHWTR